MDYAREFLKDWARLSHSGLYDMNRLKAVMLQFIANDALKNLSLIEATRLDSDHGRSGDPSALHLSP